MLLDISVVLSQKDVLAERIRRRIEIGAFPLGTRISEKDLATEMQVSRTPVREALLQLQTEGLIVVRPRSGTFVFDLTADDISQICALRSLFESGALQMATQLASTGLIGSLMAPVAAAGLALEAGDFAKCEELDTAFHETLVAASDNRYLIDSYKNISSRVRALRSRLPQSHDRIANAIAQHRKIIDLVALGNVKGACDEIAAHVRNVEHLLR